MTNETGNIQLLNTALSHAQPGIQHKSQSRALPCETMDLADGSLTVLRHTVASKHTTHKTIKALRKETVDSADGLLVVLRHAHLSIQCTRQFRLF